MQKCNIRNIKLYTIALLYILLFWAQKAYAMVGDYTLDFQNIETINATVLPKKELKKIKAMIIENIERNRSRKFAMAFLNPEAVLRGKGKARLGPNGELVVNKNANIDGTVDFITFSKITKIDKDNYTITIDIQSINKRGIYLSIRNKLNIFRNNLILEKFNRSQKSEMAVKVAKQIVNYINRFIKKKK
jgi:hypothetical protein